MEDYQAQRTIEEILDIETGEIILAKDFFKKPESELLAYRRRLAEAIAGFEKPKFVCAYCNQLLKLSGKKIARGEVKYFAHLYDSDDCEIKTNGNLTRQEIEAKKYSNIRESERHKELKAKIAGLLSSENSKSNGIQSVEVEKRITSNVPYLFWRQPDVSAEFEDKKIVFELQLSTTFLSTIVERDIFYRLNNIYIIWIFNFSDNKEFVNLDNLMCKDIYYANKRNAFVFDDKAQAKSEKEGILYLLSIWFEPVVEDGIFMPFKSIRKEEYIRFQDLNFNSEDFKLYYKDADSMFMKYQPELRINRMDLENICIEGLRKMEKRKLEKEKLEKKKEEKIKEIKIEIENGNTTLELFQKNNKWGFRCNEFIIIEPTFSEATDLSDEGYAIVKKSNKYGMINRFGEFVLACEYKELIYLFPDQYLVNRRNEWISINVQTKEEYFIYKIKYQSNNIQLEKISNKAYFVRGKDLIGILHEVYAFMKYDSIESFMENDLAKATRGGYWDSAIYNNGYYQRKKFVTGSTVYIEKSGEEQISDEIELKDNIFKGTKFGKWGVETGDKLTIIPFIYDKIEEFVNGKAIASKDGLHGYIDENNNVIVPFEYDEIEAFVDKKAIACKNGLYGYIDENNNEIIPFVYNKIEKFINGKAIACKSWSYGYISEMNDVLVPFEYQSIRNFVDGKAIAIKDEFFGYIDGFNNIIIPFEYSDFYKFVDGRAKVKKNGLWGYIDECNNIIIPCKYLEINDFDDGEALAKKGEFWGYINEQGIELIRNSKALNEELFKGEKFGKWGVIDAEGNIVIPFSFELIEILFEDKLRVKGDKLYGVMDFLGNTLIPLEYRQIGDIADGLLKVNKNGLCGYIDERNNIIIPFEYDIMEEFINGKAVACKKGLWGEIDRQGNELPRDIQALNEELFKGEKFGRWGVVDAKGKTIIPFNYEHIELLIEDKLKVKGNNLYGVMDFLGNTLIPLEYSQIRDFVDEKLEVIKNGEKGFINLDGTGIFIFTEKIIFTGRYGERITDFKYGIKDNLNIVLVPAKYDRIDDLKNGMAFIYCDKKYTGIESWEKIFKYKVGAINDKGELIIPCIFDTIDPFVDGKATARRNGKLMIIDQLGNEVTLTRIINWDRYTVGSRYFGRVCHLVKFGVFVELEVGFNALLHNSELLKCDKNIDDFEVGEEIEVEIQSIEKERKRVSLALVNKDF